MPDLPPVNDSTGGFDFARKVELFFYVSCDLAFKNKGVLTPVTLIPMGEISYDYVYIYNMYIYIYTNIYLSSPAFESLHVIQVGRCDT